MPLPGKKPPYGFVCPHRNYCPHLEGLSTGWVWGEYQRSGHIARGKAPVFMARLTSTLKTLCASPCGFDAAENLRARLVDPKREYPRLFTFLHHEGVYPTNNHTPPTARPVAMWIEPA